MSLDSKVVWSDGMFLSPEHFARQGLYLESWVEGRCAGQPYWWGFSSLQINHEALGQGLLAIDFAKGVFPDGTPFSIGPGASELAPLDGLGDVRDALVVLALPRRGELTSDMALEQRNDPVSRFRPREEAPSDEHAVQHEDDVIDVVTARPALRLMLQSDDTSAYTTVALARIVQCRADKQVELDESYIPPCLNHTVSARLDKMLTELANAMRQKAQQTSEMIRGRGMGGAAEISDFLYLMVLNRFHPWLSHCTSSSGLHPERCYATLLQAAGELATITRDEQLPEDMPTYAHDDLAATFEPLHIELRRSVVGYHPTERAISIPVEPHRYGMWTADIHDKTLFDGAQFVLTVTAAVPPGRLITDFPKFVTTGSDHKIQELVSLNLRGIELVHKAAAPREIRTYPGAAHFELDSHGADWQHLKQATCIAFRVGGEFPNLNMELWAIRR